MNTYLMCVFGEGERGGGEGACMTPVHIGKVIKDST